MHGFTIMHKIITWFHFHVKLINVEHECLLKTTIHDIAGNMQVHAWYSEVVVELYRMSTYITKLPRLIAFIG